MKRFQNSGTSGFKAGPLFRTLPPVGRYVVLAITLLSIPHIMIRAQPQMETNDVSSNNQAVDTNDSSTPEMTLSKNSYLITGPVVIRPGMDYELTVQTLRPEPIKVSAAIVAKSFESAPHSYGPTRQAEAPTKPLVTIATAEGVFSPADIGRLTIKIPTDLADEFGSRLAVHIEATDPVTGKPLGLNSQKPPAITPKPRAIHPPIGVRNESDLTYNAKTKSFLVQTDKAKYKPSDKVQFRVIVMDSSLKPLSGKINVYISDPKGNRVKQWKSQELNTGMFKNELQLANKAVLGTWQITAEDDVTNPTLTADAEGDDPAQPRSGTSVQVAKSFDVEEYVLPTFDVKLTLPPYGLLDKKVVKVIGSLEAKYTFGGFVPGKATINFKDTYGEYVPKLGSVKYEQTEMALDTPGSGPTNFEVAIDYADKENFMEDTFVYGHAFVLTVSFVDSLTLKPRTVSQNIQVYSFPLQLTLSGPPYYKPGLPYGLKIEATQVDGKPLSPQDALAYKSIELKKMFSYSKPHYITNDTFVHEMGKKLEVELDPKTSTAYMTFDDTDSNVYRLSFEALFPKQPRTYTLSANKFEEPSEIYLELSDSSQESKILKLGSEHVIKVRASIPLTNVTLLFVSRGTTVDIMTLSSDINSTTAQAKFLVSPRLAPRFFVLAYTLSPAGNVIADSVEFQVDQLTQNTVKLGFAATTNGPESKAGTNETVPTFKPGTEARLDIGTAPGSLVGVLAVDRSVRLLAEGNDVTIDDIAAELDSYTSSGGHRPVPYPRGGRGRWAPWSRAGNSYQIFKDAGLLVLTDADLYVGNEMIYARQFAPVGFAGGPMMDSAPMAFAQASSRSIATKQGGLNIVTRKEFPETWIWEDTTADAQGHAQITKKVPDTITTWVATAISLNNETGIGLSENPAELRVFMPFFVALNLPYSVIRGEKVRIQALVYNYLGQDVQAHVQLEPENGSGDAVKAYEVLDEFHPVHGNVEGSVKPPVGENQNLTRFTADHHKVNIKSGDIASIYFYISPLVVGNIKLKVKAETANAGDAIEKFLPVKAEGSPVFYSKTFLVNLKPENGTFKQNFLVPWDVGIMVQGSNHLEVSAIGDIMGPSLTSVGNLVRLPYGCGEQNMLNFAPNLYIYSYLRLKNHLTPALKSKIIAYTEQGYQRQLTYQREDGSFSAFGARDKSGSVWLTAFVLRSFILASERGLDLIYVDPKVIKESLEFLLDSQRLPALNATQSSAAAGNLTTFGDFPEIGEVHHKPMQGGTSKGLALTAFVYIALKETQMLASPTSAPASAANPFLDDRTLRRLNRSLSLAEQYMAHRLLADSTNLTPYDLAILAYALTVAQARPGAQAKGLSNEVRARRNVPDNVTPNTTSPNRDVIAKESAFNLTAGTASSKQGSGQNETLPPTTTHSPGLLTLVTEKIHDIVTHALHSSMNDNNVAPNTSQNVVESLSSQKLADVAAGAFERLMAASKVDSNGDFRFWSQPLESASCTGPDTEACRHEPVSLDYETTAYALLVLTALGKIDEGLPVLRWLVTHRNSLGGFSSTQDTIVALNALSKFSSLLPSGNQSLKVSVAGDLTSHEWDINQANSFVQNIYSFGPTLEKEISLGAEGVGIALIQVSWTYNLKNASKGSGFTIEAKTRLKDNKLKVDICLHYRGAGDRSNMAIVEVNAPTGYVIDKESIKPEQGTALDAKISELTDAGTKLNLYFDSIGANKECFRIHMEKLYEVQDIKPSLVKVSDYYQPEYQSTATIAIPNDFALD